MKNWLWIVLLSSCLVAGGCHRQGQSHSTVHAIGASPRYPSTPQAAFQAFISGLDRRDARSAWELLAPDRKAATSLAQIRQLMSAPEYETDSKVVAVVFHGPTQADVEYQSDILKKEAPMARGSFRFVGRAIRLSSGGWAVDAIDIPVPAKEFTERRAWNHEHLRPLVKAMKDTKNH